MRKGNFKGPSRSPSKQGSEKLRRGEGVLDDDEDEDANLEVVKCKYFSVIDCT